MSQSLITLLTSKDSLPACHKAQALEIDHQLQQGKPWQALKGCRLGRNKHLIRFRLGRNWRLLYWCNRDGFGPVAVVTRQAFERFIK